MKTKEEVFEKMLDLHKIGVTLTLKHSVYIPDVSFEFTKFPTPEDKGIIKRRLPIEVSIYANETYDDICDRIDRFLKYRQDFLDQFATDDFKSLLNNNGLIEYLKNRESK